MITEPLNLTLEVLTYVVHQTVWGMSGAIVCVIPRTVVRDSDCDLGAYIQGLSGGSEVLASRDGLI